jgi:hypothetical protein
MATLNKVTYWQEKQFIPSRFPCVLRRQFKTIHLDQERQIQQVLQSPQVRFTLLLRLQHIVSQITVVCAGSQWQRDLSRGP